MKESKQTGLIIFLVVAIILGSLWQFFPLPSAKERLDTLPLRGLTFIGRQVPLDPFEEVFFAGTNVVKRLYNIEGEVVFLTIVDGTNNRQVVHDPFFCFAGAGWVLEEEKILTIPNGSALFYRMDKNGEKKEAMVWFSNGANNFTSTLRYWMETTLRRITLGLSGGEPVLIIFQPVERTTLDTENIIENFKPIFEV